MDPHRLSFLCILQLLPTGGSLRPESLHQQTLSSPEDSASHRAFCTGSFSQSPQRVPARYWALVNGPVIPVLSKLAQGMRRSWFWEECLSYAKPGLAWAGRKQGLPWSYGERGREGLEISLLQWQERKPRRVYPLPKGRQEFKLLRNPLTHCWGWREEGEGWASRVTVSALLTDLSLHVLRAVRLEPSRLITVSPAAFLLVLGEDAPRWGVTVSLSHPLGLVEALPIPSIAPFCPLGHGPVQAWG